MKLVLVLFILLIGARSGDPIVCRTWEDVNVPWDLVASSLGQLEAGGVGALSLDAGGNIDRIRRSTEALVSCAILQLPQAVRSTYEDVVRNEGECNTAILEGALSHNVSFADDACCNATLRASECCVHRPYEFRVKSVAVNALVASDSSSLGLTCGASDLARFLLSQFNRLYDRSINGLCEEQTDGRDETVVASMGLVRSCFDRVYRPDVKCSQNSHCLSDVCFEERCVPDPTAGAELLLKCLLSDLPEAIRPLLRIELGLPVTSVDADLEKAFKKAVISPLCEERPNPLDVWVDARYSLSIYGAASREECEDADPIVCEDGGAVDECDKRSICAYDFGDASMALRSNVSTCVGLCSNPLVAGQECEQMDGCSVAEEGEAACGRGGSCSDAQQLFSSGTCVFPFSAAGGHEDVCDKNQVRLAVGCRPYTDVSEAECVERGGEWLEVATSAQQCLGEERCVQDAVAPVWQWSAASWGRGRVVTPFKERKCRALRNRRWLERVDWSKVETLFEAVFTKRVALRMGSLIRCQVVPALTILRYALCDCSNLVGRPASDKCWDYTAPLVLGVRSVTKGTSDSALTPGGGRITWFLSSCVDDSVPCVLEFGLLLRPPPSLGSTSVRDTSGLLYEPIYNGASEVVGVALSDLLYVGMSARLRGGIELCIVPNVEALQTNCTACEPAFGFASSGSALLAFAPTIPITERDNSYCGTITQPGYYVATRMQPDAAHALGTSLGLLLISLIAACVAI